MPGRSGRIGFTIGQVDLQLKAAGESLEVGLNTFTPNFKGYEIRIDNGKWIPSGEIYKWQVKPGANQLEARTVNAFGITGAISKVEIEVVS